LTPGPLALVLRSQHPWHACAPHTLKHWQPLLGEAPEAFDYLLTEESGDKSTTAQRISALLRQIHLAQKRAVSLVTTKFREEEVILDSRKRDLASLERTAQPRERFLQVTPK
jgi:hypothetical protein